MAVGTAIAQRGDTSSSLLARSDQAMYENKANNGAAAIGRL
jgi:predicted signal transduction protein with EAL and GGDEF domain